MNLSDTWAPVFKIWDPTGLSPAPFLTHLEKSRGCELYVQRLHLEYFGCKNWFILRWWMNAGKNRKLVKLFMINDTFKCQVSTDESAGQTGLRPTLKIAQVKLNRKHFVTRVTHSDSSERLQMQEREKTMENSSFSAPSCSNSTHWRWVGPKPQLSL